MITNIKLGDSDILIIYYGSTQVYLPDPSVEPEEPPVEPEEPNAIFNVNDFLNIHDNPDYTLAGYSGRYIQLEPNTAYKVTFDASDTLTGLIVINNIESAWTGSAYMDFRKTAMQTRQYTTNENGYLYIACTTDIDNSTYNTIITTRNLRIEKV